MSDFPTHEEQVIIQKARAGEAESFTQLVCIYRESVIRVAYRMCGDAALAEDAAQVAFLKAWQRLSQFRAGASFRSWIYRIAINAAIDLLRRERPQLDLDALDLASPESSPSSWMDARERIVGVRRAILDLPEASRSVLILKEYEDLSYREIADVLDIPVGTVMSRLNYARSVLAKRLRSELEAA